MKKFNHYVKKQKDGTFLGFIGIFEIGKFGICSYSISTKIKRLNPKDSRLDCAELQKNI